MHFDLVLVCQNENRKSCVENVFKKGHRIRLDISSSNFPQFDVNPNTGDPLWSSKTTISAKQQIHHDKNNISFITLPVIKQDIHKQNLLSSSWLAMF